MGLKDDASYKLNQAYQDALHNPDATCNHTDFIDYIIDNSHLTYKYVLFTAILAKATDPAINPLCLQKKSELNGAYDARTICHKVIVPFEMEVLKKALGGSNEPFLNKPARFPELDKNNAVRRGNDQRLLNALCDNLPHIETAADAYQCLVYLLTKLIKIRDSKKNLATVSVNPSTNTPARLMYYIEKALEQSYEGEVLTLLIAGAYHLKYQNSPAVVEVHPVNQSGASTHEISDLDIYLNDNLILSNELKDKPYAETDVRHAADKVISAGAYNMFFVEGPRGNATSDFKYDIEQEYLEKDFVLRIISYRDLIPGIIVPLPAIDAQEFMHFIIQTAQETKFKDTTIAYLISLAETILGLTHL